MSITFESEEEANASLETNASLDPSDALEALMTARDGADFLAVSLPTFWRRVADGTIPPPIKLGRLSRWPRSEIVAVVASAKTRRNNA